ncbi:MAG: hypothetical protein WCT77_01995 [Bacteroidota bacterium]|jgi:hypothetical protein
MKKRYKKSELEIHTYGGGRNKKFIVYTDFVRDYYGSRTSYTRVYPDVKGNKANAIKEALDWLNNKDIYEPWIVRNKPCKFLIQYSWGK